MKRKQDNDSEIVEEVAEDEVKKVKKPKTEKDSSLSKNFDIKKFRYNLKQGNFYDDLKQFLKLSEKSNKYVESYVKSGGKPLEVIETIKVNEEGNLEIVSSLYRMLRLVVYDVIKQKDENLMPTVQALQYLINRNKSSINKMLKSTNSEDKILILKILSISISLDGNLAQEVIKSLELSNLYEKSDHPLKDSEKNVVYEESLRLAFMHFILAFLLDDNLMSRKRIVRKTPLFELFMSNLQQDSFDVIKLVFTSLTKNVLICSAFSKPEKLKIFSENVIKSILKLYEWTGPKKSLMSSSQSSESKENVAAIAHEFLLLLLTSKKHGIVFKALSEKSQNQRQSQVISYFKNCWNFELQSQLVIEIIKACPDLMQNILTRLVFALKPTVQISWFLAMNFTKQLLLALEPSEMIQHIKMLEPKKISANIIKFSISQFLLQNLESNALAAIPNVSVRENAVHLILICLQQCTKYLEEIKNLENLKHFQIHRIKFDILNHIFTFLPNIDLILNSLYRSVTMAKDSVDPDVQESLRNQLKYTLDLLLLVTKHFPAVLEKIPSIIDYLEVLRPVYELQNKTEQVDGNIESLEIEMKVAKLILHLEPAILSVDSNRFEKIFQTLFQIYCFSNDKTQKAEAKGLLSIVLKNLDVFPTEIEIDLWIEACKFVSKQEVKIVSNVLVKTFRDFKETSTTIDDADEEVEDVENFMQILRYIDKMDDDSVDVRKFELSLSGIYKQLFVSWGSKKLTKISRYIEVISVFLFHFAGPKLFHPHEKLSELDLTVQKYFQKQAKGKFQTLVQYFDAGGYDAIDWLVNGTPASKELLETVESDGQLMVLLLQLIFTLKFTDFGDQQLIFDWIQICYEKLMEMESGTVSGKLELLEELDPEELAKISKIKDLTSTKCSEKFLEFVLMDQHFLENFEIENTNTTVMLMRIFKTHPKFQELTVNYRAKIVENLEFRENFDGINELLENFNLTGSNCLEILEKVVALSDDTVQLLGFLLNRLTELKTDALTPELVRKLEESYNLFTSNSRNMTKFETSFHDYLKVFCHNIGDLSTDLFQFCFKNLDDNELKIRMSSKSFIRLMCLLFSRNDAYNGIFLENYALITSRKELLYPLMNVAFAKGILSEQSKELKGVYQEFKNGIQKAIEKPHKAAQIYRENTLANLKMIEFCMSANECQDLCTRKFKFEQTELFQLQMLFKIFEKSVKSAENDGIYLSFVNNWLQLFNLLTSKKTTMDLEYLKVLDSFCGLARNHAIDLNEVNEKNWENFYRICLKFGLKDYPQMLVTLGKLIDCLIPDDSANEEIPKIFDMILTHSNFFNVSFSFKNTEVKKNLYYLLNVLVQKDHSVASEKHIPIYLASYHATMTKSDQLILNLIRFYELNCNIDLNDFKPMLFGATALNHYSDEDKEFFAGKKSVDNLKSAIENLLNSFEKHLLELTVNNFPIQRNLKTLTLKEIEELLKSSDQDEHVYDPAFFLPLFDMICSTSTWDFSPIFIRNNLLSVIWPALSSTNETMRLLAAHTLLKFREVSENKKNHIEIWTRFYDSIQLGLSEIKENQNGKKGSFPRPASISTQYIAEISNILPNSLHELYSVVSNYLIVMKSFQFNTVPEYLLLFHSSDVKHVEYQQFLLTTVLNGIKDDLDMKLLNNTPLLKMLFACYNCPLSNRKVNELILRILNKLVVKTQKVEFLVKQYGLIIWLYQVVNSLEAFEYETIDIIIEFIRNIAFSLDFKVNKGREKLLLMLLKILPKFTKSKLSTSTFAKFLDTILKLDCLKELREEDVNLILELVQVFVSDEKAFELKYMKEFPGSVKFLESGQKFKESIEKDLDADSVKVIERSRNIFLNYYKNL